MLGSCVLLTSACGGSGGGGHGGAGGAGGTGTGGAGGDSIGEEPFPGELCTDPSPALLANNAIHVRVKPGKLFLPPCPAGSTSCTTRTVKVSVDPDTCVRSAVTFESADPSVVPAPAATSVELHHDEVSVVVRGGEESGSTVVTVHAAVMQRPDASSAPVEIGEVTTSFDVEVLEPTLPACTGSAAGKVHADGVPLLLGGASIRLPVGADKPISGSLLWPVQPFDASVGCGADAAIPGYEALGPAITFGPEAAVFRRDVPLSIPLNPALVPTAARFRHLRVAYAGPAFRQPRVIAVADPHIEQVNGAWALSFKAPRLGTYQAVVAEDAGTKTFKRRLTYRATVGVSMGGGGAASFGMRHHDRFDVLAPLGGPVDWTYMLDYIEKQHLGGFRRIESGTSLAQIQLAAASCSCAADCQPDETCVGKDGLPPGKCRLLAKVSVPYEHPQTFNTWWYEYPRTGNGGNFDRAGYTQIFRDLALMFGNPIGENLAPDGENLPAGVPPDHPSVVGEHPNRACAVWVEPLPCPADASGDVPDTCPEEQHQQEIEDTCPAERCAHTLTLLSYYDDEYNPDGAFPVITVCDGASQDKEYTPYSNTWHPEGNGLPLELGLAVDYNGNGVRDELEPIIRSGHEPWHDDGEDGISSSQEPGYAPGVNDDPAGDDYDPQYNPAGTEGDHRYQVGEHFDDFGLDGVPNTLQQPSTGWQKPGEGYDVGEGDGEFTVSRGLQRFWDRDGHSIARRMVDPSRVPGGELTDAALSRVDVWTDGGLRDLFNFGVAAQHLAGSFAARGRMSTYLSTVQQAPGLESATSYDPKLVDFGDLPGIVLQRYGVVDPTQGDIDDGSGQHVGSVTEITARVQAAIYFVGARWKDHPELTMQVDADPDKAPPGTPTCQLTGNCTFNFTSKGGRTGPVGISLPPGYVNADLQDVRYPVIYVLHGYGQKPEDLEAIIVFLKSWMNDPSKSSATRLPKAIVVYVDGRCRTNADGSAECIRGTFYADSPNPKRAQDEQWWLELMEHIDQNYRTLGEETVDWTE